ncbi:hypothetical protein [Wohlfahrtiimonas sp. G9077]|uniref:hypothetical protein n=1 Tax=Wohlfahrtiimonas sp. G9077 TaxID=1980118 RepID=UPI000B983DE9|nr:hypothetical protein [Wohlfahrtiimonas sp. G9077]OYQ72962.1 hypothetical protein B9T20_08485 [Wohlfahrtiimonas sp. G9077]
MIRALILSTLLLLPSAAFAVDAQSSDRCVILEDGAELCLKAPKQPSNAQPNPKAVAEALTQLLALPQDYEPSLQAGLNFLSKKDPSEIDVVTLVNQLLTVNDVPSEIGNTLQSYVTMITQDSQEAEDQFLKAGTGLLKLIIQASKETDEE